MQLVLQEMVKIEGVVPDNPLGQVTSIADELFQLWKPEKPPT